MPACLGRGRTGKWAESVLDGMGGSPRLVLLCRWRQGLRGCFTSWTKVPKKEMRGKQHAGIEFLCLRVYSRSIAHVGLDRICIEICRLNNHCHLEYEHACCLLSYVPKPFEETSMVAST